jgi:hypothetical protein
MESAGEIKDLEFSIKRSIFDSNPRRLIIAENTLSFEDSMLKDSPPTTLKRDEIKAIRYGIIRKAHFSFVFSIYIQSISGQVLEISFSSFFGYKRNEKAEQLNKIVNGIGDRFLNSLLWTFLENLENNIPVEICNTIIEPDKLILIKQGLINSRKVSIEWDQVGFRAYKGHFTLYSKVDPGLINQKFSYLEDWSAVLLYNVMKNKLNKEEI